MHRLMGSYEFPRYYKNLRQSLSLEAGKPRSQQVAEMRTYRLDEERLEPFAAVGDPPTGHANRDRGDEGPPKWQYQVGNEPNDREGHPKNFALHEVILAAYGQR